MRKRSTILEEWLARAAGAWPEQTARRLLGDPDPFHNPVGHALRMSLPVLLDAVLDATLPGVDAVAALERLVKIGAVQDAAPGQTISLLLLLKPTLRERPDGDVAGEEIQTMEARIDSLVSLAVDLQARCRQDIHRIQADEARRGTYVQRHLGSVLA